MAKQPAQTSSSKIDAVARRNEAGILLEAARNDHFARVPIWMFYLPITAREKLLLGRIYSFQFTADKAGKPHQFSMSLARTSKQLNLSDRGKVGKMLRTLVEGGYLLKKPQGRGKSPVYEVNEVFCVQVAVDQGWSTLL